MDREQEHTETTPQSPMASGDEVFANAPKTATVGGPNGGNPADAWTGQYPPNDRPKSPAERSRQGDRQGPVCGEDGACI